MYQAAANRYHFVDFGFGFPGIPFVVLFALGLYCPKSVPLAKLFDLFLIRDDSLEELVYFGQRRAAAVGEAEITFGQWLVMRDFVYCDEDLLLVRLHPYGEGLHDAVDFPIVAKEEGLLPLGLLDFFNDGQAGCLIEIEGCAGTATEELEAVGPGTIRGRRPGGPHRNAGPRQIAQPAVRQYCHQPETAGSGTEQGPQTALVLPPGRLAVIAFANVEIAGRDVSSDPIRAGGSVIEAPGRAIADSGSSRHQGVINAPGGSSRGFLVSINNPVRA